MALMRIMVKCLGIIGIFVLPLFAVTLGFNFLNDLSDSGYFINLNNLLSYLNGL